MGIHTLSTSIVIDKDGKITLPEIAMNFLNWGPGSVVEVDVETDYSQGVHLWTDVPQCIFCYDIEGPFYKYRGGVKELLICKDCQGEIQDLRPNLKEYLNRENSTDEE